MITKDGWFVDEDPPCNGKYFVTIIDRDDKRIVSKDIYNDQLEHSWSYDRVVAWQPIQNPKPYMD